MCTFIINWCPDKEWPAIIAANRDELITRPWKVPGRHWPDRPEIVAGFDEEAGGSWLGINKYGLVAGILNRTNSLGPMQGKRSRGELVLEALDHADAFEAAKAIKDINEKAYREFNMLITDNRDAFWIRNNGVSPISSQRLPIGISMLAAHELNDTTSPRIDHYLDKLQSIKTPNPETNDWQEWKAVLADRSCHIKNDPRTAMNINTDDGFGTVSSSLIALPKSTDFNPVWLFCSGAPDENEFLPIYF
jgi:uncharacterized protein with NRDE domain